MQRLVSLKKINQLKKVFKKPLIKSCTGELLPDFRTYNKSGFDVTTNREYLNGDSDIPNLLRIVNKYCPVALVHGIYDMNKKMDIIFGGIDLRVELKDNKIIKTTVKEKFGCFTSKFTKIEFEGNDIDKVFQNKYVRAHIEYAILSKALVKQYDI